MGNFNNDGNRRGRFKPGGRDFGQGGRDAGRPRFPKKDWGGRGSGNRETTMFRATCSECGNSCEVPFRPTGDKPVYCNNCFGKKLRMEPRRDFNDRPRRDFGERAPMDSPKPHFETNQRPPNDDVKKQLEALNGKLDRLIKLVEALVPVSKPKKPTKRKKT